MKENVKSSYRLVPRPKKQSTAAGQGDECASAAAAFAMESLFCWIQKFNRAASSHHLNVPSVLMGMDEWNEGEQKNRPRIENEMTMNLMT